MPHVSSTQYHSIVISDHCPVQLDFKFPDNVATQCTWRLNPLLLSSNAFKKFLSAQTDFFIETNSTPDISHCTIWESMLAYLRGQIISYTANENKQRTKRLTELSQRILDVATDYAASPSPIRRYCFYRLNLMFSPPHRRKGCC